MRLCFAIAATLLEVVSCATGFGETSNDGHALRPRQLGSSSPSPLANSGSGLASSTTASGPEPPPNPADSVPYPFTYPFPQPHPSCGVWNTTTKGSLYQDTMYIVHLFKG